MSNRNSEFYVENCTIKQKKDLYYLKDLSMYKFTLSGENIRIDNVDFTLVSDIVKENANSFINIKPNWENVMNKVFMDNPRGKFILNRWYSSRELGYDTNPFNIAEINLVRAVLHTARYVYRNQRSL